MCTRRRRQGGPRSTWTIRPTCLSTAAPLASMPPPLEARTDGKVMGIDVQVPRRPELRWRHESQGTLGALFQWGHLATRGLPLAGPGLEASTETLSRDVSAFFCLPRATSLIPGIPQAVARDKLWRCCCSPGGKGGLQALTHDRGRGAIWDTSGITPRVGCGPQTHTLTLIQSYTQSHLFIHSHTLTHYYTYTHIHRHIHTHSHTCAAIAQ